MIDCNFKVKIIIVTAYQKKLLARIFPAHPPAIRVTPVRPSLASALPPAVVAAQIYHTQVLQE